MDLVKKMIDIIKNRNNQYMIKNKSGTIILKSNNVIEKFKEIKNMLSDRVDIEIQSEEKKTEGTQFGFEFCELLDLSKKICYVLDKKPIIFLISDDEELRDKVLLFCNKYKNLEDKVDVVVFIGDVDMEIKWNEWRTIWKSNGYN